MDIEKSDFQSFQEIGIIYEAVSERGKRFQHKFLSEPQQSTKRVSGAWAEGEQLNKRTNKDQ